MNAHNLDESAPLKLLIRDIQPSQSIQLPTTHFAGSFYARCSGSLDVG